MLYKLSQFYNINLLNSTIDLIFHILQFQPSVFKLRNRIQQTIISMTWYNSQLTTSKQLDTLIQKKPLFSQLLCYADFIQHLKSYNTKLLQYLTNYQSLPKQMITFLAVSPADVDVHDRKYRLPLLTLQAVQSETICILNSFFRQDPETKAPYLITLFKTLLSVDQVLPLLAGYFFRVNECLLRSKTKETVDAIYLREDTLKLVLNHADNMAIVNSMQIYINLDNSKCSQSPLRAQINVNLVRSIFQKIEQQAKIPQNNQKKVRIIENLTYSLIQLIDKYYLIADGKPIMDIITSQSSVRLMAQIMLAEKEESFPVMNFFLTLLRHYSCSSFNTQDLQSIDNAKRALDLLQSIPLVIILSQHFEEAIRRIMKNKTISLYEYRLLQVFCHSTSLVSYQIFNKIKSIRFYQSIIELLFRNDKCSILHMLIQRAFLHIFVTEKRIYEDYKKHLFCQLGIIDLTSGRLLNIIKDKGLAQARKLGYFGSFMKILKIYSAIQTFDQDISNAIKARSDIWSKTSKFLIKPYEQIISKDLGNYADVPDPKQLEFTVDRKSETNPQRLINNSTVIEEVQREEAVPTLKSSTSDSQKNQQINNGNFQNSTASTCSPKFDEDNFFKVPNLSQSIEQISQIKQSQTERQQQNQSQKKNEQQQNAQEKTLKKSQSYQDFLSRQKVEIGKQFKEVKNQRSHSTKGRLVSPSPKKKNSWKQQGDKDNQIDTSKQSKNLSQSLKSGTKSLKIPKVNGPKIPISPRVTGKSMVIQHKQKQDDDRRLAKSLVNLQQLKNIKVMRVQKPGQRKFRRLQQKDRILLDFLGIRN